MSVNITSKKQSKNSNADFSAALESFAQSLQHLRDLMRRVKNLSEISEPDLLVSLIHSTRDLENLIRHIENHPEISDTDFVTVLKYSTKNLRHLRNLVVHYERKYYIENHPEISDADFDAIMKALEALEATTVASIPLDTPTQRVGGTALGASIQHRNPMLSLQ